MKKGSGGREELRVSGLHWHGGRVCLLVHGNVAGVLRLVRCGLDDGGVDGQGRESFQGVVT